MWFYNAMSGGATPTGYPEHDPSDSNTLVWMMDSTAACVIVHVGTQLNLRHGQNIYILFVLFFNENIWICFSA